MLSKTDYNRYLQCPKLLWLSKNRKELAAPVTETDQAIFDQGHLVESYADKLFPDNPATVKDWYARGQAETRKYINEGHKTIFQANALTNNLYCKGDILHFNDDTKKWDLYEVKSSTQVKDEHIPDLTFQKIAFTKSGTTSTTGTPNGTPTGAPNGTQIDKTFLIHINNQYIKNGEIDPKELLTIEDLTDQVEDLRKTTEDNIPKALETIKLTQEPQIQIGKQCSNPYECPFKKYCWKNLPEQNIFDLQRITQKQLTALQNAGIEKIADIPDDFELTDKQQNQVTTTKTGKAIIDKEAIQNELNNLQYPLYFLDYETYAPAIPLFDGLKPYQQMPFQYSLHVIKNKGQEPEHYEYLHTSADNPIPGLLASMKEHIGNTGSVIVWYKGFECGRNEEMAELYLEYAEFLNSVNSRVFDLMEIFKDQYYVSPKFKGSCSIKKVLPVVVPELSYADLEDIQEGGMASLYWFKHIYNNSPERDRIARSLLEYCKLDTLAMVEIWRKLG